MSCAVIGNMEGTLSAREGQLMIMDTVSEIKLAIYGLGKRGEMLRLGELCLSSRFLQFHSSWRIERSSGIVHGWFVLCIQI